MNAPLSALVLPILAGLSSCSMAPQTYDQHCSKPLAHWGTEKNGIGHLRIVNAIKLDDMGKLTWNGVPISDNRLRDFTLQSGKMNPEPQLVLEVTANAHCDRVAAVRLIMDAAPICQGKYSLCSEGRDWKNWEELGGP